MAGDGRSALTYGTCISSDSPEQRLHTEVLLDKRLQRVILTGDTLEPVDLAGREGGG